MTQFYLKRWALLSMLLCFSLTGLLAATITVTSTADSGAGTLREAVSMAVDGDDIVFDASTDGTNIKLSSMITISTDVTITGNGIPTTALSGQGSTRIFNITDATVTIQNLVMVGGSTTMSGGALQNMGGTVTLVGIQISSSVASGAAANMGGGAIHNAGTMTISDSKIIGNQATGASGSGGGILNASGGQLTITNSEIVENSANRAGGGIEDASGPETTTELTDIFIVGNTVGNAPGNGGGVHITGGGDMNITGGDVVSNVAASEGGGLWNHNGTMTVTDVSIRNNIANGDEANTGGGGIYNLNEGTLVVRNSELKGNSAPGTSGSGGGILNDEDGVLMVMNTSFLTNTASRAGGGIEDNSRAGSMVTIMDTDFFGNRTGSNPGNGGAIHITGDGNMNISGGDVTKNRAASEGGGFWNGSGTMTVSGVNFDGNKAFGDASDNGGGAIFNNGGILAVLNNTVINNNGAPGAAGSGGGIFNADGGCLTVTGGVISRNFARRAGGGIEDASNTSDPTVLNGVEIRDNITGNSPGNGGGVHVSGTANVNVNGGLFTGNFAFSEGGALWNGMGTMTVTDASIQNNRANGRGADNGGGGIYALNGGTLVISGGDITGNNATKGSGSGGGLLIDEGATVTISGTTFEGNSANRAGGGIEDNSGSSTTTEVTDVTFIGNSTGSRPGNGGAIHITGAGNMNITGARATMNTAANQGGAFWNGTGSMTVMASSIFDNSATNAGGGLYNLPGGLLGVAVSTVSGNMAANGGGVWNGGDATIGATTIAMNDASETGGGITTLDGGSTTLNSSIVADNTAPSGSDLSGTTTSADYNLIGEASAGFTAMGNDLVGVDPMLMALALNGGDTETHAIDCTSPAVDAGDPSLSMDDQRGVAPVGTRDIGSYEFEGECDSPEGRTAVAQIQEGLEIAPDVNNQFTLTEQSQLFPNPSADGRVQLVVSTEFSEAFTIMIFDVTGKRIQNVIGSNRVNNLNLSDQPAGTYIVKIVSNDRTETHKLITRQ